MSFFHQSDESCIGHVYLDSVVHLSSLVSAPVFQLVLTVGLLAVVVYLYTVVAFNFFRKFYNKSEDGELPDMKCDDMLTVSMSSVLVNTIDANILNIFDLILCLGQNKPPVWHEPKLSNGRLCWLVLHVSIITAF